MAYFLYPCQAEDGTGWVFTWNGGKQIKVSAEAALRRPRRRLLPAYPAAHGRRPIGPKPAEPPALLAPLLTGPSSAPRDNLPPPHPDGLPPSSGVE